VYISRSHFFSSWTTIPIFKENSARVLWPLVQLSNVAICTTSAGNISPIKVGKKVEHYSAKFKLLCIQKGLISDMLNKKTSQKWDGGLLFLAGAPVTIRKTVY
jgi:hypothetical protein